MVRTFPTMDADQITSSSIFLLEKNTLVFTNLVAWEPGVVMYQNQKIKKKVLKKGFEHIPKVYSYTGYNMYNEFTNESHSL